jgi:hypothetical protein
MTTSASSNRRGPESSPSIFDEVVRKGELPAGERVVEVGVVVTSLTVSATDPIERGGAV